MEIKIQTELQPCGYVRLRGFDDAALIKE